MRITHLMLTGACALVLAMPSIAVDDSVPNAPVPAAWTSPGIQWLVRIKQDARVWGLGYSDPRMRERAQKPRVAFESHIRITILEPQGEGDERVARMRFAALDDAPEYARGTYVLELDASTGKPKTLKRIDGKASGSIAIENAGTERVLLTQVYGFPTSWIVNAVDLAPIPARTLDRSVIDKTSHSLVKKLRPTVTADGEHRALEVDVSTSWLDADPSTRIVQTWVPGEGWWRTFTRYIQGHIDLEATLVDRKEE